RIARRRGRAVSRTSPGLSYHGRSGRLLHFRTAERTACRRRHPNRIGRHVPDFHRHDLSGLASFENSTRRSAAIRIMRYWYEGFLGLRYLRASPRRGFVSLIAGIAILGLALGVAVLIVVLSVMNGFEEELRTRILSLTAHATVSGLEGRIAQWRPDVAKLAQFPGVAAAAPYIEAQGMMTHGAQSAGVLLRGIVPADERRVADLSGHLLTGGLGDLVAG